MYTTSTPTELLKRFNGLRLWLPQMFSYIKQMELEGESLSSCEILSANLTRSTKNCDDLKEDKSIYINMLYVTLLTTVSFASSTYLVRVIGKKNLFIILNTLGTCAICALPWVKPPFTILLAAIFVALLNTTSIGLLGFSVQLFPTKLRTMAVSLTMVFGRVGVVIGQEVLPFFLSLGCTGTFIGVGAIALLSGLSLCLLPQNAETKDVENSTENSQQKGNN